MEEHFEIKPHKKDNNKKIRNPKRKKNLKEKNQRTKIHYKSTTTTYILCIIFGKKARTERCVNFFFNATLK